MWPSRGEWSGGCGGGERGKARNLGFVGLRDRGSDLFGTARRS